MAPLRVSVFASELMRVSPAKVIAPWYSLLLDMFLRAPPLLMPVPVRLRASAPIVIPPESSKAAPLDTVTPPAVVPSAVLLEARKAPALMAVAPV